MKMISNTRRCNKTAPCLSQYLFKVYKENMINAFFFNLKKKKNLCEEFYPLIINVNLSSKLRSPDNSALISNNVKVLR